MPWTEYRDDCPGCRPCVVNLATGIPYAEDSDIGKAIGRVWSVTTRAQKQAFHAVTCNSSRDHVDMMLAERVVHSIQKAIG